VVYFLKPKWVRGKKKFANHISNSYPTLYSVAESSPLTAGNQKLWSMAKT